MRQHLINTYAELMNSRAKERLPLDAYSKAADALFPELTEDELLAAEAKVGGISTE